MTTLTITEAVGYDENNGGNLTLNFSGLDSVTPVENNDFFIKVGYNGSYLTRSGGSGAQFFVSGHGSGNTTKSVRIGNGLNTADNTDGITALTHFYLTINLANIKSAVGDYGNSFIVYAMNFDATDPTGTANTNENTTVHDADAIFVSENHPFIVLGGGSGDPYIAPFYLIKLSRKPQDVKTSTHFFDCEL